MRAAAKTRFRDRCGSLLTIRALGGCHGGHDDRRDLRAGEKRVALSSQLRAGDAPRFENTMYSLSPARRFAAAAGVSRRRVEQDGKLRYSTLSSRGLLRDQCDVRP